MLLEEGKARKTTHSLQGQHPDVEESVRIAKDRDKQRKYVRGMANPRIEDGSRTEQNRVLVDRKSRNPTSSNRPLSDLKGETAHRKSAYRDDNLLLIGDADGVYSVEDRAPFDLNTGTVQRRVAGKAATSPRSVDGMERRLPVGTESVTDSRESATDSQESVADPPESVADSRESATDSPESATDPRESITDSPESVTDSPYRKEEEKERAPARHSPGRTVTPSAAKNGTRAGRTKVDDIQRLTERDRAPAEQNRKQLNHVTRAPSPRVDESTTTTTKPTRGRGHKSTAATPPITSGTDVSLFPATTLFGRRVPKSPEIRFAVHTSIKCTK